MIPTTLVAPVKEARLVWVLTVLVAMGTLDAWSLPREEAAEVERFCSRTTSKMITSRAPGAMCQEVAWMNLKGSSRRRMAAV